MILRTPRLLLRSFTADDGAALHSYLSRPEVIEFEPYPVLDRAGAEDWAAARAQDERFLAVCLDDGSPAGGRLIGNTFLGVATGPQPETYTLGYVFHSDVWGRGYATEAARAVVEDAISRLGAHRVVASCNPANPRSWRLLERLGMRREAEERQSVSFGTDDDGARLWHDVLRYAVLAEEWRERGSAGS